MTVVLNGKTGMTHYATRQYEEVFGSFYKLLCTEKKVYVPHITSQWGLVNAKMHWVLVNAKMTCSKCRKKRNEMRKHGTIKK